MPHSSTDRARSSEGRYTSSILVGASILLFSLLGAFVLTPPIEEDVVRETNVPVDTEVLVSMDIPLDCSFCDDQWRTIYEMLIAKGIDGMEIGHYDHIHDIFCVVKVVYTDGRELCWDGQSESFSVQ